MVYHKAKFNIRIGTNNQMQSFGYLLMLVGMISVTIGLGFFSSLYRMLNTERILYNKYQKLTQEQGIKTLEKQGFEIQKDRYWIGKHEDFSILVFYHYNFIEQTTQLPNPEIVLVNSGLCFVVITDANQNIPTTLSTRQRISYSVAGSSKHDSQIGILIMLHDSTRAVPANEYMVQKIEKLTELAKSSGATPYNIDNLRQNEIDILVLNMQRFIPI